MAEVDRQRTSSQGDVYDIFVPTRLGVSILQSPMSELVFKKSKSKETGLVGKMQEMYLTCLISIIWDSKSGDYRFSQSKAGDDRANTKIYFTMAASLVDDSKISDHMVDILLKSKRLLGFRLT